MIVSVHQANTKPLCRLQVFAGSAKKRDSASDSFDRMELPSRSVWPVLGPSDHSLEFCPKDSLPFLHVMALNRGDSFRTVTNRLTGSGRPGDPQWWIRICEALGKRRDGECQDVEDPGARVVGDLSQSEFQHGLADEALRFVHAFGTIVIVADHLGGSEASVRAACSEYLAK